MTHAVSCSRLWCALLILSIAGVAAAQPAATAAPRADLSTLVFASGSPEGNYNALATAVAEELADSGIGVEVRQTGGSYDNARLLREDSADLALLQSDVAYLEHYNGRPFLSLASVYTEPIHIVAYRGLDLRRISELISHEDDFVAAIGAPGSGSSAHAFALIDELGLPQSRLETVQQSVDEAAEGLRNRSIDLAFVTTALPARSVRELADDRIISLLGIDRDIAQRLRNKNPFFVAAEIPYGAYGASERNIQTLGTKTLLVSRNDLPDDHVVCVLDALYAVAARPDENALAFLTALSPMSAFHDLAIPAHPAAIGYHRERGGTYQKWFAFFRHNAMPLVLLAALLLTLVRLPRFAYFIHQFILGRVLLTLIVVWLAGSAAMHFFEGDKNSAFRSFGSSAIAILHYLFSGLESKYPVTTGGNIVAILILSLGVGVVTLFTATLVTLLVENALNIRTLRTKPVPFLKLSGHVVIAGWSERTKRIIHQLRSPDLRRKPTVVVIAPHASATKVRDRRRFRGVWVVEGDRSLSSALAESDVASAASAVVLASSAADRGVDLSSICCALAIHRISPETHTIVEARASTAVEHLHRSRAGEIVDTETLAERLLSQCVITPGIAGVFDELLSFGTDSQELYILPLPRRLDGLCFREIRGRLRLCETIPLGFWQRGAQRPFLNPDAKISEIPLRSDRSGSDKLIVLADTPGALTSLRARKQQRRNAMNGSKSGAEAVASSPSVAAEAASKSGSVDSRRTARIGICGWNVEAQAVIRQLQETVIASHQEFEITVIDGPTTEDVKAECTRNVRFVFGDPTRREILDNAGVGEMEALVVLADRSSAQSERASDHRALVVCLAAREANPGLHLIAEVLESENQEHFQRIADVEIVSVEDLAEKLLAQAVISPGITTVFLELLTATEDSNEIYVVPVPECWLGRPFGRIAEDIQSDDFPAVALGYRTTTRDGRAVTVLNPRKRKAQRHGVVDWWQQPLAESDALVVMAFEEPSW